MGMPLKRYAIVMWLVAVALIGACAPDQGTSSDAGQTQPAGAASVEPSRSTVEEDYVAPAKADHRAVTSAELADILADPAAHAGENVIVYVKAGSMEMKPCPEHITGEVAASESGSGKDQVAGSAIFTEGDPLAFAPTSPPCRVMACPDQRVKIWATVSGSTFRSSTSKLLPLFRANHVDANCEQ